MADISAKLLLQLKTTGTDQLKAAAVQFDHLKASATAAAKAAGLSDRQAARALKAQNDLGKRTLSVESEMEKIQARRARTELRSQALQRLDGTKSTGSFFTGHGFANRMRSVVGGVRDLTVAAYGMQMAFGAVGGAVGSVLDPLRAFQMSMAQVQAKGMSAKDMPALAALTKDIGRTTQFAPTQSAAAAVALAAAGVTDMADMRAALPTSLRFSQASGLDAATASDTLVDTAGQFELKATDFERIGDAMQKAADMSTIGVHDLAESLKYAGAIAKQVGFELEDTTATIALLGERGIKGSEAGTALRGIFSRMAKPTKMASKALDALGIDKEQVHGFINNKDIPGYFRELDRKMKDKGYTDAQRLEASKAIFGQEQLTAALNLMTAANTKGADGISIWDAYIAKNRQAAGSLKRTADLMGDTVEGKIQKFNASLETAKITLAEQFIPTLDRLIPKFAAAATSAGRFVEQNGKLIAGLAGISTAAATAAIGWKGLTLLGGMLPASAAITAAGTTIGVTFAAAVVAAITGYGIGTALLEATKNTQTGTNVMEDFGRWAFDSQYGTGVERTDERGMGGPGTDVSQESVTEGKPAAPDLGQFNAVTGQIEIKVTDSRVSVRSISRGPVKLRTGANPSAPDPLVPSYPGI